MYEKQKELVNTIIDFAASIDKRIAKIATRDLLLFSLFVVGADGKLSAAEARTMSQIFETEFDSDVIVDKYNSIDWESYREETPEFLALLLHGDKATNSTYEESLSYHYVRSLLNLGQSLASCDGMSDVEDDMLTDYLADLLYLVKTTLE